MRILVTGANGFIGRNLVARLKNMKEDKNKNVASNFIIYEYDQTTNPDLLPLYCSNADFVFNLAGVNRPENITDYMKDNFGFASVLLDTLEKCGNRCPIMLASSIQAQLDNPYGQSKKAGEDLFFDYARRMNSKVLVYRFPNVFGKWCRPNYNSVIATFCYNVARGIPIKINDSNSLLYLVYIDDLVNEMLNALKNEEHYDGLFNTVPIVYRYNLGYIADLICSFKMTRDDKTIPNMGDDFIKKLYATYLSYLPENSFSYPLIMNIDARGSFTEMIRTQDRGQVSVNISNQGVVKGNHWHNTKSEKFLVVKGQGVIRLRKISEKEVFEYYVSGDKLEVVDIPVGYTHNIENLGITEMITIMWANEPFNSEYPDTYYLEV
ncbi:UDP-2-acetamido-2,6-beta-L-arabino-hexul-4-ose reductase [bioreactor metagenome]|uniref:UDP-2-acetamido-2,6-beta-L-arabino-hexul-4-ose reductase n=1 Tax=bioreactor metagenome TaxID=1076179 RepID=A0A644ZTE5_9ZZZZ|nr:NAD-dependent epimerase/dehydratase family protein [Erysipelotrichaceae bacterium]